MSKSHHPRFIRLFLCSWNVGASKPVPSFVDALGFDSESLPEIYVLGLQEVDIYDRFVDDNLWARALLNDLSDRNYIRIKIRRLQGLMILVFVKRSILPFVTSIESEATKTGFGGLWGNKGSVSIRLDVFGVNVIIINSHFAAHQNNAAERIIDFNMTLDDQKFKDSDVENILDHDYVFWMGDLNFRLDDLSRDEVVKYVDESRFEKLLLNDQLVKCCEEKLIFEDFQEGKISFPPTYKFDVGTDDYDSSPKRRIPAWCDRILWHVYDSDYGDVDLCVKQLDYTSHPIYKISDHKPVTSVFDISVFSNPIQPPVRFDAQSKLYAGQDAIIKYAMDPHTKAVSSDWIGLYKSDFSNFGEYVTYVWAVEDADRKSGVSVTLRGGYLKTGKYYLCYMTRKYSLQGISEQFVIV